MVYRVKKIVQRGLLGFPIGVFISYSITILISLIVANGYYSPTVPSLVQKYGSEISAVTWQFILSGMLGAAYSIGSIIWEIDHWSILKQTVTHFFVISCSMFPIAYMMLWMEHSMWGVARYLGIFIGIYTVVWVIQYFIWKRKIKKVNDKIKESN